MGGKAPASSIIPQSVLSNFCLALFSVILSASSWLKKCLQLNHGVHMLYFCLQKGIKTNATQSIPSPVTNLCDVNSNVKLEKLLGAIGWEYLRTCPYFAEDRGEDFIGKQRGFQFINPTDQWFPGKCKLFSPFIFSVCLTYAHMLVNVGLTFWRQIFFSNFSTPCL